MTAVAHRMIGKSVRPRVSGLVVRPRLFQRLDVRQPLTWVWGPPGSGKTTLVASYLAARRIRSLWYRLDAGDADVAAFLHDLSKYRFAYGVVGDQVNLGSRLEGLNKVYGTRTQVVRIYELVGKAGAALSSAHDQALSVYAEALEAYRKGMWTETLGLFQQALSLRPDDGPSRTLARRCLEYRDTPPEPWDGVFDQQYK